MPRLKNNKIGYYYLTDSAITNLTAIEQVQTIVDSGIGLRFIQYREKFLPVSMIVQELKDISSILSSSTKLIVNDRLDLALSYADGVHLGEEDFPVDQAISLARDQLGKKDFVIGTSATSLDSLVKLNALKIDYVGFGPVFSTTTKSDAAKPLGLEGLGKAIKLSGHPLVAIGGINPGNLASVLSLKPSGISAISLVLKKDSVDLETIKSIQSSLL